MRIEVERSGDADPLPRCTVEHVVFGLIIECPVQKKGRYLFSRVRRDIDSHSSMVNVSVVGIIAQRVGLVKIGILCYLVRA